MEEIQVEVMKEIWANALNERRILICSIANDMPIPILARLIC